MTYEQAGTLRQALTHGQLKAKPLTGSQFVDLLNFKKDIAKFSEDANEVDQELMKEYGVTADHLGQFVYPTAEGAIKPVDFVSKIREGRKALNFEPKKKNFIDQKEFLLWVADLDVENATTLAEYLLKTE